jgi:RHH-type transcriptional regulator, rel operon repressor / antitoxin RelB
MPTSVRLDQDIESRLNKLAQETGRTKAFYIREIIANGIEDIEDYYSAMKVLERVRRGEEKTYSSEEVRRALGLED